MTWVIIVLHDYDQQEDINVEAAFTQIARNALRHEKEEEL